MTTTGARLREAREKAGLTLEQLGDLMGCTRQNVSRAEKDNPTPSLEWLYRAAVALRCKPSGLDPRLSHSIAEPLKSTTAH